MSHCWGDTWKKLKSYSKITIQRLHYWPLLEWLLCTLNRNISTQIHVNSHRLPTQLMNALQLAVCTESNENIQNDTTGQKQQHGTVSKQMCALLQLSLLFVKGMSGGVGEWETSRTMHSPLCCWQCRPRLPPACLPPPGEVFCHYLPRSWPGRHLTCPQSPGWLFHSCR